jgi:asparagine synthase (glutamine-hydrolysing)
MDRPKMGFGVPIAQWFSDELKLYLDHYFDPVLLKQQGLFNVSNILNMKDKYLSGKNYYINRIWMLLVFQMWYERWMN